MLVNICGRSPENFQHNTGNGLQDEKWGQETLDKLEGQLSKVGKSLPQFNVNYRLGFSCSSQYDKDRSWMLLWHIMIPYISGKGFAYKDIIRLLHGMSGRFLHFNHSLIKNSPNLSLNSL